MKSENISNLEDEEEIYEDIPEINLNKLTSSQDNKIKETPTHNSIEFSKLLEKDKTDKDQLKRLEEIVSYLKSQKQPFQESELSQIFDRLDFDGDNVISSEEIKRFLNSLKSPVNDYYIEKMIKDFDMDRKGDIRKEEFLGKLKNQNDKGDNHLTELLEIFKLFDANHDDVICDQDLQNMLKALGENFDQNTFKEMMSFLGDQNGKINFSRFFELVKDEDK